MIKLVKKITVFVAMCLMFPLSIQAEVLYTTDAVNFRSEPEIGDNVIEVIDVNTEVEISNEEIINSFQKVIINEKEGYIHSNYLADTSQLEYLGNYKVTGYKMFDPAENGGRSDGVTASGVVGEPGRTVAMKDIEFGTRIYIGGLGEYVVEDRGVGSGIVDVACWTTNECYALTGYYDVYIVQD